MKNEKFIVENKYGVKTYARLTDEVVIIKSVDSNSNKVVNIDRIPLGTMLLHQNIMNALKP